MQKAPRPSLVSRSGRLRTRYRCLPVITCREVWLCAVAGKSDRFRPSIRRQFVYFQHWVKCVTDTDGMTELRGLRQKPTRLPSTRKMKFTRR